MRRRPDRRVKQAEAILALLDSAHEHGFKADDYGRSALARRMNAANGDGKSGADVLACRPATSPPFRRR
jgi:hypothetical protein